MAEEEWQKKLWDMGQRLAMQVAEKPPGLRQAALEIVERNVRMMVVEMGVFAAGRRTPVPMGAAPSVEASPK